MRTRSPAIFSILVLGLVASTSAGATETGNAPTHQAVASATASGEYDFDEAGLTFSVNNDGLDPADLAAKLAKKGNGLVEAMKAAGLTDADIRVSGPSIAVRYATIRNTNGSETIDRQKLDGFSGFISVSARFQDFSKLGKAMSDGVKLGAAVSGPNFALSVESNEKCLAELAVDATKSAYSNAKAMIEATGRKAGRVIEIRAEGGIRPLSEPVMRTMAVAAPAPDLQIPVNPGRANLTKTISVAVEILEP